MLDAETVEMFGLNEDTHRHEILAANAFYDELKRRFDADMPCNYSILKGSKKSTLTVHSPISNSVKTFVDTLTNCIKLRPKMIGLLLYNGQKANSSILKSEYLNMDKGADDEEDTETLYPEIQDRRKPKDYMMSMRAGMEESAKLTAAMLRNAQLEGELSSLRTMSQMQLTNAVAAKASELSFQIATVNSQLERANDRALHAEERAKIDLEAKLEAAKNQHLQSISALEKSYDRTVYEKENEINRLKNELQSLNDKITIQAEASLKGADSEQQYLDSLEDELKKLETENNEMKLELMKLTYAKESKQPDISGIIGGLGSLISGLKGGGIAGTGDEAAASAPPPPPPPRPSGRAIPSFLNRCAPEQYTVLCDVVQTCENPAVYSMVSNFHQQLKNAARAKSQPQPEPEPEQGEYGNGYERGDGE